MRITINWVYLLATAVVALAVAGCSPSNPPDLNLSEQDVAAIVTAQQAFVSAELSGNWAEAAQVFSENAVRMEPHQPLLDGRDAIQAVLESNDFALESFSLTSVEIIGNGPLAVNRGTYDITFTDPTSGKRISDQGKYITVWRKNSEGKWQIVSAIYNSDLPIAD